MQSYLGVFMKKSLISLIFLSFLVISPTQILAVENNVEPKADGSPQNGTNQAVNQASPLARQDLTTPLAAQQQASSKIAANHAQRLQTRFEFYYQRLQQIAEKIQARLQTMANNGLETTAAQAKLQTALQLLEQAKIKGDEAIKQFEAIDPTQYQAQRQMALQAGETAQAARNQFRTARQTMLEAVQIAMQQLNDQAE